MAQGVSLKVSRCCYGLSEFNLLLSLVVGVITARHFYTRVGAATVRSLAQGEQERARLPVCRIFQGGTGEDGAIQPRRRRQAPPGHYPHLVPVELDQVSRLTFNNGVWVWY